MNTAAEAYEQGWADGHNADSDTATHNPYGTIQGTHENRVHKAHMDARTLASTWELLAETEEEGKAHTDTYGFGAQYGAMNALSYTDKDVERVARAMHDKFYVHPELSYLWENSDNPHKTLWMEQAATALEAMGMKREER